MAQLKDLIVNGPSRFIGDVYATTFTGDLNGNANTATSATTATALTGKTLVTASAVTTSNWSTYADNHIPTMSFMAYWNGAYSGTSSNLAYCAQGAIIGSNNIGNQSVSYATTSGSCNGNAATATKATQDSDGNVIRDNYIRKDGNNGTAAGVSTLINKLDAGSSTPTDADYYVCQYAGGGTTTTTYHRRPMSSMWNWIKAKTDTLYPTKSGSGATGTWGINISGNAATATNADKLDGYHASSFSLTSHTHSYIVTQGDNRSTATKPSDYNNRITFAGLKTNDTVGNPSSTIYNYVVGLRGWSDTSGGKAHELAFNNNGIFHRIGATDAWEAWDQLETKGNTTGYLNAISKSGNTLTITPKGGTAFTFTDTTYSRKWDDNLSNTDYPGYGDATVTDNASFSLVNVGDMKRWNKASYMLEGLETLLASI